MKIRREIASGVAINMTGDEVATAIDAYLVACGVVVSGPRTIRVNSELITDGRVYVDPSGYVIAKGQKIEGHNQYQHLRNNNMNRVLKENEHVRATDYYINNDGGESHIQLDELGRLAGGFKGDVFRPVTEPMTFDIVASSEPLDATEEFHSSKGELLHPKADDSQDKPVTDEEWNGEGYPNIGDIVNFRTRHYAEGDWVKVEVRYISSTVHVLRRSNDGLDQSVGTLDRNDEWFIRPIRTEAQLAEEERKADKTSLMHDLSAQYPPANNMENIIDDLADFILERIATAK